MCGERVTESEPCWRQGQGVVQNVPFALATTGLWFDARLYKTLHRAGKAALAISVGSKVLGGIKIDVDIEILRSSP